MIAPAASPGGIPGSVSIPPNTNFAFLANIIQSTAQPTIVLSHYEIRMTLSSDVGAIVNCFAQDSVTRIVAGNTVLHHQLIQL